MPAYRPAIQRMFVKEEHPDDYNGFPFLSLVEFRERHILVIISNVSPKFIKGYDVSRCDSNMDEEVLIECAKDWWDNKKEIPFSVYLGANGLARYFQRALITIPICKLKRVIGPTPKYEMDSIIKPKRKRRIKVVVDPVLDGLITQIFHGGNKTVANDHGKLYNFTIPCRSF